jgi:tRNA (mo5U34)-methyltransferase
VQGLTVPRSVLPVRPGPHPADPAEPDRDLHRRLAAHLYYHTIDVGPGLTTEGWWDLRHAVGSIPFPDVEGRRCLDIGTWDGFYAFELERRGAAEVVALDVPDLNQLDYPPAGRADPAFQAPPPNRNEGFGLLKAALGSKVELRKGNIYDFEPGRDGQFDVVVLGSLLLHLRDPVRALDAVRRVVRPGGALISVDHLNPLLQIRARRW